MVDSQVDQAFLFLASGFETFKVGRKLALGRHDRDHLGAQVDGDPSGCFLQLEFGPMQAVEGDVRDIHICSIGTTIRAL
jgi:hypothetical protein